MYAGTIFADTHFTRPSSPVLGFTPSPSLALRVEMYQLRVPAGKVSGNEKFWKPVDEHCIDPARYDLLLKNGVRVGIAPLSQWDYCRELLADHPAVSQVSDLVAAEAKPVEFTVRKDVPEQDIFYYDASNHLIGRSFDASEDLIAITFQRAPRKPRTMRIVICPVVRAHFKRLEFTPRNRGVELKYVTPERLYDMNLQADVPLGSFLIVAPSPQATWPTSIGNNFFTTDSPAEKLENVLVIVPTAIRIQPATTAAASR